MKVEYSGEVLFLEKYIDVLYTLCIGNICIYKQVTMEYMYIHQTTKSRLISHSADYIKYVCMSLVVYLFHFPRVLKPSSVLFPRLGAVVSALPLGAEFPPRYPPRVLS